MMIGEDATVRRPRRLAQSMQTICTAVSLFCFAGHLIAIGTAGTVLAVEDQRSIPWLGVTFALALALIGTALWFTTHPGIAGSLQWAMVNVLALSCAMIKWLEVEQWVSLYFPWAAALTLVPPLLSVAVSRQPIGWKVTGSIFLPSFALGLIAWIEAFGLEIVLNYGGPTLVLVVVPVLAVAIAKRQPRIATIAGSVSAVMLSIWSVLWLTMVRENLWALVLPAWTLIYLILWIVRIRQGHRIARSGR